MQRLVHILLGLMLSLLLSQANAQGVLVRTIQQNAVEAGVPISTDDAEQENDAMDALDDDDIDAGWEGEPDDQNVLTAGMRFRNIYVPQGAVIDSAYIIVYSHEDKSTDDVAELVIHGEDSDDPATYDLNSLITDRTYISETVDWTVEEEWGLWSRERTPDITDIVQALVNRPGWVSGNSMAFMIAGTNQGPSDVENAREWESFENIADPEDGGDGQNHPERIPRLVIYSSAISSIHTPVVGALRVYPNPSASTQVTVELAGAQAATLQVFNQQGQMVLKQAHIGEQVVTLNTQDLAAGLYFLQVEQADKLYTEELVITRQ